MKALSATAAFSQKQNRTDNFVKQCVLLKLKVGAAGRHFGTLRLVHWWVLPRALLATFLGLFPWSLQRLVNLQVLAIWRQIFKNGSQLLCFHLHLVELTPKPTTTFSCSFGFLVLLGWACSTPRPSASSSSKFWTSLSLCSFNFCSPEELASVAFLPPAGAPQFEEAPVILVDPEPKW